MWVGRIIPGVLLGLSALMKLVLPEQTLEGFDISDQYLAGATALHALDYAIFR